MNPGTCRYQNEVAADIAAIIPDDVVRILDVGCGEGFVQQWLPARCSVVDVDISVASLRRVNGPRVAADICWLPFPDRTFDLVMANDVLEHLSTDRREKAIQELARVSSRFVLVTVPLLEDLNLASVRCADCEMFYHVNHHVKCFGLAELRGLLSQVGYRCDLQVISGDEWHAQPAEAVYVRRLLSLESPCQSGVLCPSCGSKNVVAGPAETVLNVFLDELACRMCLQDRSLADRTQLRTECISLYQKQDTIRRNSPNCFIDFHSRQVSLRSEGVPVTSISFTNPELFQRQSFPTYSPLPYFICANMTSGGALVVPGAPASVGFFVHPCPAEGLELEIQGEAEKATSLLVWSYNDYKGYHSPSVLSVKGRFSATVKLPNAELSRFGLVFQLQVETGKASLEKVALVNVKGEDRRVYDNPDGMARFRVLEDDGKLLLSLPFYGKQLVELEWMREPASLENVPHRLVLSDPACRAAGNELHAFSTLLIMRWDDLSRLVSTLLRDIEVMRIGSEQTMWRRVRRMLTRVWNRTLATVR